MAIPTNRYLPHIDGLRALAVLSVVLHHAAPTYIPGGFLGVDIFFVISGYLITAIVAHELTSGSFDIRAFFFRRIRRLMPALVVMLLSGLMLALLILTPQELVSFAKHSFAAILLSSNILSAGETGYFDPDAINKPLLHLWSLGVEEQFYLIWPFLLLLGIRYIRIRLGLFLACLATLAWGHWLWGLLTWPDQAYYLPTTRGWELAAGGLLAWKTSEGSFFQNHNPRYAKIIGGAGLVLVTLAMVFAKPGLPETAPDLIWCALTYLAAVAGSVLIIAAGDKAMAATRLLKHPAAVFVGRISYPLYLWHWPLLVFLGFIGPALRVRP